MKAAQFGYSRAVGIDDALQRLAQGGGAAKIVSGSQSFGPMLNLRLARPTQVIDIAQIASLGDVHSMGDGVDDGVEIGAAVTHAEIEDGVHPPLLSHPMRSVAAGIAYRAIRTRGTVGGSLAHADPAADWVVTLAAMGARIKVRSRRGERTLAADAFLVGAYTTVLEFDELIVSAIVPAATPSTRWGYSKLCRKPGEFAHASAAAWFEPTRKIARICLGAVDGPPILLQELAAAIASNGDSGVSRQQLRAQIAEALPGRDAADLKFFTVCLERALAQAGVRVHI